MLALAACGGDDDSTAATDTTASSDDGGTTGDDGGDDRRQRRRRWIWASSTRTASSSSPAFANNPLTAAMAGDDADYEENAARLEALADEAPDEIEDAMATISDGVSTQMAEALEGHRHVGSAGVRRS